MDDNNGKLNRKGKEEAESKDEVKKEANNKDSQDKKDGDVDTNKKSENDERLEREKKDMQMAIKMSLGEDVLSEKEIVSQLVELTKIKVMSNRKLVNESKLVKSKILGILDSLPDEREYFWNVNYNLQLIDALMPLLSEANEFLNEINQRRELGPIEVAGSADSAAAVSDSKADERIHTIFVTNAEKIKSLNERFAKLQAEIFDLISVKDEDDSRYIQFHKQPDVNEESIRAINRRVKSLENERLELFYSILRKADKIREEIRSQNRYKWAISFEDFHSRYLVKALSVAKPFLVDMEKDESLNHLKLQEAISVKPEQKSEEVSGLRLKLLIRENLIQYKKNLQLLSKFCNDQNVSSEDKAEMLTDSLKLGNFLSTQMAIICKKFDVKGVDENVEVSDADVLNFINIEILFSGKDKDVDNDKNKNQAKEEVKANILDDDIDLKKYLRK